jgi:hypothetical protein
LNAIFFNVQQASFDATAAAAEPGAEWRMVGEVPLKVAKNNGLAPAATQPSGKEQEYKSGAIVLIEPVPADQARLVDATFKVTRATDAIIPEVFVAEGPFDEARASSAKNLAWQFKGGAARLVLADGTVPKDERVDVRKSPTVSVKIRFDKETVIVDSGDKRLYEGPIGLSPTAPRYVGVRFRRKVGDGSDGVWLSQVSVLKP